MNLALDARFPEVRACIRSWQNLGIFSGERVPGPAQHATLRHRPGTVARDIARVVSTVRRCVPHRIPDTGARVLALEHDPEKWIPVFGQDHAPRPCSNNSTAKAPSAEAR